MVLQEVGGHSKEILKLLDGGTLICIDRDIEAITKTKETLKEYEKKVVAVRLLEMSIIGITGDFSLSHFVDIHKKILGDIYFFAGEFRKENIAKGSFRFADYRYMENEITRLFQIISKDNIIENKSIGKDVLAEKLAYYSAELNVLHPFREGNGRTIREYIRQMALKLGYIMNYRKISVQEYITASIFSITDISKLKEIYNMCLEKIDGI